MGSFKIKLNTPVYFVSWANAAASAEGKGPLAGKIDMIFQDDMLEQISWEKAESSLFEYAVNSALTKSGMDKSAISFMSGGDLLNQIISASYSARNIGIPFLGLYGACSTFAESLIINSLVLSAGYGKYAISATSSHFSSAERQYRYPLEYGNQRPMTSQRTVTGAGAALITNIPNDNPHITDICIGGVVDLGINDPANMGAAMAPSAADTISSQIANPSLGPDYYDKIITGDLGKLGSKLLLELMKEKGFDISKTYTDCGLEIYPVNDQDCGGSGCGCSAVVITAKYLDELKKKNLNRILYVATGALLSPTATLQGETIPGVAHGMTIEA